MEKILVIAPHNDDEILGCGGTIAKLTGQGKEVFICEVTKGDTFENLKCEAKKAHELLGIKKTFFLNLPVCKLDSMHQTDINAAMMGVIREVEPDVVFIPHEGDIHSDHAETSKAAMVCLRPVSSKVREIYAYETLSETEWNKPNVSNAFLPNVYADISDTLEKKCAAMKCYKSQLRNFPHPRSVEAIEALAKFRGASICTQAAEAFMLLRKVGF